MKRKDAGEVNDDDLFDFTLSSPALKIRRLDAELAPIIDEQGGSNPVEFGQSMESSPIAIDELRNSLPVNEERAIVLFNPNKDTPSFKSRIPFSISTGSDFLSRFKNPVFWSSGSDTPISLADETQKQYNDSGVTDACLAVVPWVPGHLQQPPTSVINDTDAETSGMMDSDAMDVEDNYNAPQMAKHHSGQHVAASATQDWNQWQQHCMIQQPPNNYSTPVTWLGQISE